MTDKSTNLFPGRLILPGICLAVSGFFFLLHYNIALNLADEGYLWYGVQKVFEGKTPVLDFESYDPGRYYWSALFFHFWRPGLVPLRLAEAFFQCLGLLAGLWIARRHLASRTELGLLALLLGTWMFPHFKFFDCALPAIAIFAASRLIECDSPRQVWMVWSLVGLVYGMGRNHGLYLGLACACVTLIRGLEKRWRFSHWGWALRGLALGCLPFLFWLTLTPGTLRAYETMVFHYYAFEKTRALTLPIPWFWNLGQEAGSWPEKATLALAANLLPCFYFLWIRRFWKNRRAADSLDRTLLACGLVGLLYLHYFYSRADLEHLAVALGPFLLGFSCWQASLRLFSPVFLTSFFLLSFFWLAGPYHFFPAHAAQRGAFVEYPIGRDKILINPSQADLLNSVSAILASRAPGDGFAAWPGFPGLYAIFNLDSPTWAIYPILPATLSEQQQMVSQLQANHVRWILMENAKLDGQENLRFSQTHPLVWNYLQTHALYPRPIVTAGLLLFVFPHAKPPGR